MDKNISSLEELHSFLNEKREGYPMENGFCVDDVLPDDLVTGNFDEATFTVPRDNDGMYGAGYDIIHVHYTGPVKGE